MKKYSSDLNNRNDYPGMVGWFDPIPLLKTVKKVITSTVFGQYADRRLVHASLTSIDPDKVVETCCGGTEGLLSEKIKEQKPVWVDYVADLGDGFDSTYAIAYLIGQKEIQVNDNLKLPRADCLIMGGDQVYPDASREDYEKRMERPYSFAFPLNNAKGSSPPVYLIPGNHDWYDGLSIFLARFCSNTGKSFIGNWKLKQSRSYFAVHLAQNWWIWGFDIQLGEDIDKPQADYFTAVAKKMEPNAKIIICASVPSWLRADTMADEKEKDCYYRSLDYMANIISKNCPDAKTPLIISGDLHHYSRYIAKESGTNFITAGGGGAFLHPTHNLSDKLEIVWALSKQTLEIGKDNGKSGTNKAFYPPQEVSRKLALGNIGFAFNNWKFCFVIGGLYWLCAMLLLAWTGYGENGGPGVFASRVGNQIGNISLTPIFVIIVVLLFLALYNAADIKNITRKRIVTILHTLAHLALIVTGASVTSILFVGLKSWTTIGEILYFFMLGIGIFIFGIIGSAVWGFYLTLVSWLWGDEANNAFSALRLDSYRHFVRLKIEDDKITIYPIGIDVAPKRNDWKFNNSYKKDSVDIPIVVPLKELGQHLIEDPVVIEVDKVTVLRFQHNPQN